MSTQTTLLFHQPRPRPFRAPILHRNNILESISSNQRCFLLSHNDFLTFYFPEMTLPRDAVTASLHTAAQRLDGSLPVALNTDLIETMAVLASYLLQNQQPSKCRGQLDMATTPREATAIVLLGTIDSDVVEV